MGHFRRLIAFLLTVSFSVILLRSGTPQAAGGRADPFRDLPYLISIDEIDPETVSCSETIVKDEPWHILLYQSTRKAYPDGAELEFVREVFKMNTPTGFQRAADIHVRFNPSYSDWKFLWLRKKSGGNVWVDVSFEEKVTNDGIVNDLYQDEKEITVIPKGLDVGESVDFAYAIYTRPSKELPLYSLEIKAGFYVPICLEQHIIELPLDWEVRYKVSESAPTPQASKGKTLRYTWILRDVEKRPFVDNLPDDYVFHPVLNLVQKTEWIDINKYFYEFHEKFPFSQKILAYSDYLIGDEKNTLDKVSILSSWVQKNIRYVDVSFDDRRLVPADPELVLERKFGDCKDMSMLLRNLIRAQGIPAHVALMKSPGSGIFVPELPDPYQFDHAIVAVEVNRKLIFIDPTNSLAKPPWAGAIQNGRPVLVLDGLHGLMTVSGQPDSMDIIKVSYEMERADEEAILKAEKGKEPSKGKDIFEVKVKTRYEGPHVANIQYYYEGSEKEEIEGDFRHHFDASFPGIELDTLGSTWDLSPATVITEDNHFFAADPFDKVPPNLYYFEMIPEELKLFLDVQDFKDRKYPWAQRFPFKIEASFHHSYDPERKLIMGDSWTFKENDFFHLDRVESELDGIITVKWTLETLREDVPAERLAEYRELCKSAMAQVPFSMNLSIPVDLKHSMAGWLIVLLAGQLILLGIMLFTQNVTGMLRWKIWRFAFIPVLGIVLVAIAMLLAHPMYEETRKRPRPALLVWIRETLTHDGGFLLALLAILVSLQCFGYLARYRDINVSGIEGLAGIALIVIFYKLVKRWSMRAGSPARGVGMIKWHAGMQIVFMLGMLLFFSIVLAAFSFSFIRKFGSEETKALIEDDATNLVSFWWIGVIVELFRNFLFALGFAGLFAPPPHRSLWFRVQQYGAMLGWGKVVLSILAAFGISLVLRNDLAILEHVIYPLPSKAIFALQCVTGFAWTAVVLILHLWLTKSMVTLAVDHEFSPPREEPDEKKDYIDE